MSLMTDDEVNEILDTVEHMLDGVETPNLDALRRRNGHGGPPNNGARCRAQSTGSLRSPDCNPIGVSGPDLTSPGTGASVSSVHRSQPVWSMALTEGFEEWPERMGAGSVSHMQGEP